MAWLYRSSTGSLVGTVARVPTAGGETLEYSTHVSDLALAPELAVGGGYPWIDGYWQAYHVAMILAGNWVPREFVPTAARYFRLGGVTGWQPLDATLPNGAEDLGVREGAWDHEHCELCNGHIDRERGPHGYVDPEGHWLCESCYRRYAIDRDLAFLLEE